MLKFIPLFVVARKNSNGTHGTPRSYLSAYYGQDEGEIAYSTSRLETLILWVGRCYFSLALVQMETLSSGALRGRGSGTARGGRAGIRASAVSRSRSEAHESAADTSSAATPTPALVPSCASTRSRRGRGRGATASPLPGIASTCDSLINLLPRHPLVPFHYCINLEG